MQKTHTRTTVWVRRPRRKFMKQAIASCIRQNSSNSSQTSAWHSKEYSGEVYTLMKYDGRLCKRSHTIGNTTSWWTGSQIQTPTPHKGIIKNQKRACLGKPRRINSYIWWVVESKPVDQVRVREIEKNMKEVRRFSLKMVMERWFFSFFWLSSSRGRSHRGSHPRSSNDCVSDGSVHTLTCCTYIFWCTYTARTLRTFLCVLHTCMAQGCLQCACHFSLDSPSPFSCFTRPCFCLPRCSLTVTSRPLPTTTSLTLTSTTSHRIFPTWKRRSSALRTRTSCLAIWPSPPSTGGYEPKKFDKITSVDNDTTLTDDPDHDIYDFSKITGKTLDNSVFPQCLNSLFRTFLIGDFVSQRKSKESMQPGNSC